MAKIKIAFVISNLGQGGAERQFSYLFSNLDRSIFEIDILLYAVQKEPFYNCELNDSSLVVTKNKLKNKIKLFKIIEALTVIRIFLKSKDYDLVISSLFMNNLFLRLAAPKRYKNKIVTNMRTSILNYPWYYKIFEVILIKNSFIVFNSQNSLDNFYKLISKKYHKRLFLIQNGFVMPKKNENINNVIAVGSLGRLNVEKNFIQTIRVFQNIATEFPNIFLIIQGNRGNQYFDIKEIITCKNIELRDKDLNIENFFSNIRILIIPSFYEGCPNVLFEGLLRNKICIISRGANSDDYIKNDINGFVYDGTDEDLQVSLIRAISILGTQREMEIINNGYTFASKNFNMNRMISNYEKLFLKLNESNTYSNNTF